MRVSTITYLLLILIVSTEVININAKIQLNANANKKTSLKHPRNNRKQKRRRILQTELIEAIATDCVAGTNIYVSTDVKDLALQMKELLDGCSKLELELNRRVTDSNVATKSTTESTSTKSSKESPTESSTESFEGWMAQSILSIPSERELVCEQDWRPVYRTSYRVK